MHDGGRAAAPRRCAPRCAAGVAPPPTCSRGLRGGATIPSTSAAHPVVDGPGAGAVDGDVHATIPNGGAPDVCARARRSRDDAAGGARLSWPPPPALAVVVEWHRPAPGARTTMRLWPDPDAAAGARPRPSRTRRSSARGVWSTCRRLDEDVRPVVDAVLDAFGLLAAAPLGDGLAPVRLPVALITDPLGWFPHAGRARWRGRRLDPPQTSVASLDALKPILGVDAARPAGLGSRDRCHFVADDNGGGPARHRGRHRAARADPARGRDRLEATAARWPDARRRAAPDARRVELSARHARGATLGQPGGPRRRSTADPDRGLRAAGLGFRHLAVPESTRASGRIAGAATRRAATRAQRARGRDRQRHEGQGRRRRAVRSATRWRCAPAAPPTFHDAELQAWAADPAAASSRRGCRRSRLGAHRRLRDAVGPRPPAGVTVAVNGNELQVTAELGDGRHENQPVRSPHRRRAAGDLPGIGRARVEVVGDGSGLTVFDVTVGPASLDVGGATLRPYLRVHASAARPPGGRRVELGLGARRRRRDEASRALAARRRARPRRDRRRDASTPSRGGRGSRSSTRSSTSPAASSSAPARSRICSARPCGDATIGAVVDGVIVHKPAADWTPVAGLFDADLLLGRLQQLARTSCRVAKPKLDLAELTLDLVESPPGTLGVQLIPKSRYDLGGGDMTVSLEFDCVVDREETRRPTPDSSCASCTSAPRPATSPSRPVSRSTASASASRATAGRSSTCREFHDRVASRPRLRRGRCRHRYRWGRAGAVDATLRSAPRRESAAATTSRKA